MPESVMDVSEAIREAAASSLEGLHLPASEPAAPPAPPSAATADAEKTADPSTPAASDAESAPADDAAPDTTEPPTLPEGYVAVPVMQEGLATEFSLYDPDGQVEIPSLEIEYKANGKVRRDRLDRVVKLAQMGVYNYERDIARQQEVEQTVQQAQADVRERDAAIQQLLEDADTYLAARERYLAANTPEVRAQRLAEENAALKSQETQRTVQAEAQRFYTGEILPSLKVLTSALPEISEEEVASYLATAVMPLMENGIVPPKHYDTIRRYVVNELTPFVQELNDRRTAKVQQAAQSVTQQATAAQVAATKAKKDVAKVVKPAARTVDGKFTQKKSSKPTHIDDAVSDALDSVLSTIH